MSSFKNPFANAKKGLKGKFRIGEVSDDTGKKEKVIINELVTPEGVYDANLISYEFASHINEEIIFQNMIFSPKKPANGNLYYKCDAFGFVHLPHNYFTGTTKSGQPITGVKNYGNMKFKGNKLPSNPEVGVLT